MDAAEEVKNRLDIVEVISSYIPLKKSGRNYSALCPFHTEKTPSFMVTAERQVYKCFGCGEGGDVFSFVEKMEGWDFKETLVELAKRAGVEIKEFKKSEKSDLSERLISVNKLALKFYSHLLLKHKLGEGARKYLTARGIKKESLVKYGLGYAPRGWENVFAFLKKRGLADADLAASGLVIARAGGKTFYDRFRGRIIFPIRDNRGEVVGFSGRVIGGETGKDQLREEPKYVNSPETPIFHKGSLLFGLDVAKDAIRRREYVVLVEGEFDVISLYQAGVENVVASKGTALTERQIAQIKRLTENVALCFDTDVAGDAASRRGIELMDAAGMNIKVIRLGKFKDPDEFVRANAKGFKKAIRDAVNVYDYFIESASKRYNLASSIGKKNFGREILPVISRISDEVMRAHYLTRISSLLSVEVSLLASLVSSSVGALSFEKIEVRNEPSGFEKIEKYFLALFLSQSVAEKRFLKFLEASDFTLGTANELWKWLNDIIGSSGKPKKNELAVLLEKLPKNLSAFVDELYLVPVSPGFSDREQWAAEILRVASRIKHLSLKRKLGEISKELYLAEKEGNKKMIGKLNIRFRKVSEKIKEVGDA